MKSLNEQTSRIKQMMGLNEGEIYKSGSEEHDDYLKPAEAKVRFAPLTQIEIIPVDGAKHLWVGEPSVHRVLSEITKILAPERLPLPTEI